MTQMPKVLTQQEINLIADVGRYCGEIPAASLETVLHQGKSAKRFQGIDEQILGHICALAEQHRVELPTTRIR